MIEEGTTNKITNPSFENATYGANWTLSSGTPSDNTTAPYVKFGSHSYKLDTGGATNSNLTTVVDTASPNNVTHTVSAYLYRATPGSIGDVIDDNALAEIFFNGTAQSATTYTDMGGGWWRLSYTDTAPDSHSGNYGVTILEDSGIYYIDGIQMEQKDHPSTYADGSLGSNYSWDTPASPNNSPSTRSMPSLQYNGNNISATAGTVSFWVKSAHTRNVWQMPGTANVNGGFLDTGGAWSCKGLYIEDAFSMLRVTLYYSGCDNVTLYADSSAYNIDRWYHIVTTYNASNSYLYINGSQIDSKAGIAGLNEILNVNLGTTVSLAGTYNSFSGASYSDLRIFNAALSPTEVGDLYRAGLVSHSEGYSVDAFSDTKGQNPVAIWHFDEGYGLVAHDSGILGNDLTLTDTAWATSSGALNNRSQYLSFNGVSSKAVRNSDPDFNFGTDPFSIGGWFRHPSAITGIQLLVSRYGTAGFKVYLDVSGHLCFGIDDDSSWGPDDSACSERSYAESNWHHFEAVREASAIRLYVDGLRVANLESLIATGSLNSTSNLSIGADTNNSNWFAGQLDDLVIYPYARTETQVKADFFGPQTGSIHGLQSTDPLMNGLLGYWKMDENSGPSQDSSGNNLSGTWNGNTAATGGKFGNGTTLDGTGDYIDAGNFGL
jgi:hypothetical protein